MQLAAPLLQLWIDSIIAPQSVFLLHAFAGFAQILSRHLPQSVLPSVAGGGGAGVSALSFSFESEAALGADSDSGAGDPALAASADSALSPEPDEFSSAGVSGGFPPAQAAQPRTPHARRSD
jgi:hypothetical protein